MQIKVVHKSGNSGEDMVLEAQTSKTSFEIKPKEISPVEYFLSGMIACSTTDMVLLPKNQGYKISDLSIEGEAVRSENYPKKFDAIHLLYSFNSDAEDLIAKRWVLSTLETYCSTINTVRGVAKISFSIKHNGNLIVEKDEIMSGNNTENQIQDVADLGGVCEA